MRASSAPDEARRAAEWNAISRPFRRRGSMGLTERLLLLEDRLVDYGTGVHHSSEIELPATIAVVLRSRGKTKVVAPSEFPQKWLPVGIEVLRDDRLEYSVLDNSEGVITACTLAIAWTGTIVLQSGAAEGRRALTLIPDYHLCIVQASQVVELVAEAIEKLKATGAAAPTTFFSGPSATSDIEMMRVQGVHGPRVLDVILVS